jgi:hypothetical protein
MNVDARPPALDEQVRLLLGEPADRAVVVVLDVHYDDFALSNRVRIQQWHQLLGRSGVCVTSAAEVLRLVVSRPSRDGKGKRRPWRPARVVLTPRAPCPG